MDDRPPACAKCRPPVDVFRPLSGIGPVLSPVELDAEKVFLPAHVEARDEPAERVEHRYLGSRCRKAGVEESQPRTAFLWRLGATVDQPQNRPKPGNSTGAGMPGDYRLNVDDFDIGRMGERIESLNCVQARDSPADVEGGSGCSRDRQVADFGDLAA